MTTAVFILGYKVLRKGLTAEGVAHAWALGTAVFSAFGVPGFLLVCLYFIFGTLVRRGGGQWRTGGERSVAYMGLCCMCHSLSSHTIAIRHWASHH